MASGSFSNGSGQNCKLVINWNSSKGNNGSTVNATLVAQNQNNWYFSAYVYGGYGITINGNQKTGSGAQLSGSVNGSVGLISHSVWVSYTNDKTINISGYANFNGIVNLSNQTISGNATLDRVGWPPSMGSVTAPSNGIISETSTSITVSWNGGESYNNTGNYRVEVSVNGGGWTSIATGLSWNTRSYTYSLPNKSQGTSYRFRVDCSNNVGWSEYQYSGTVTLNSLSAPTIGDLSVFNPYVNSTYTVPLSGGSQASGEGFTRRCNIHVDGNYKYAGTAPSSNGNTSVNITVNASDIASDLGTKSYSSSTKFTIVAWTENSRGTRSTYVSKTFTVNLNSDGGATPTLGAPTISGGELGYPSTCFVAGISTINVVSPSATLRRAPSGTTLSYQISCSGTNSQNTQNANFYNLSQGHKTITVTVTDSRGLSVSVSKTIVVQPYAAPTIRNYLLTRLDNPQTSAKLIYELGYSNIYSYADGTNKGDQLNTINTQQYSKDNSTWVNASNELIITDLSTESIYTIYLRVADKLRPTTYTFDTQKVPTIRTNLAIRKHGIGINCIPQTSYALEVNGSSKISGSLDASNMLQVNSNGVAIGKFSEKSAFEVNMDSYFYGNETVSGKLQTKDFSINGKWKPGYICSGNGNSATYMRLCRLKITGAYTNSPIELCYSQRASPSPTVLEIGFENSSGLDPKLINFRYKGYCRAAYIVKVSTSTWDIYVTKTESWDYIAVHYWTGLDEGIELQFIGENATSVPNGWKQAANFYMEELRDKLYPVGAIYLTWNNTNPGDFLGGTWVQFGQGRTLMGQGTGNDGSTSMSFTANSSGGEYKHTLSVDEMPRHRHVLDIVTDKQNLGSPVTLGEYSSCIINAEKNYYTGTWYHTDLNGTVYNGMFSYNRGESYSHNNVQPYIVTYFWRRIA